MSDITLAASANAFNELFHALVDGFTWSSSDSGSAGPLTASYAVALHIQGGTVTLHDDGTIEVSDVDIVWDTLEVEVCFESPPDWCFGPYCIVPDPWNGCLVGFPRVCPLPTICVPLALDGLVSEITDVRAGLRTSYFVDPARTPPESDLDAEFAGHPNKWQIFVDPTFVLVEPIDFPDTITNILENAIHDAIDAALPSWLPDWARAIIWAIIGPIVDVLETVLGIVSTVADWLQDLLFNQLNLLALIETAVADYFASQNPIEQLEDPFPVLPAGPGLIPVKIPIRNLAATVNSKEMVVNADVG